MHKWEWARVLILAGVIWIFLALIFPQVIWLILVGGAMLVAGMLLGWFGRDRSGG